MHIYIYAVDFRAVDRWRERGCDCSRWCLEAYHDVVGVEAEVGECACVRVRDHQRTQNKRVLCDWDALITCGFVRWSVTVDNGPRSWLW